MKDALKEAGLTENESKLYITLLELGPSNAGLLSRKSGLHRRVVYDTSEMLIQKGLIGYIKKNNVRLFSATDPTRVMEILKEKEEHIQSIMPNLLALFSSTKEREETNFFKGKSGLKTVFEDQISTGKEIFILGASPLAYQMLQFYFHWFDKRRVKANIKSKIIFHTSKGVPRVPNAEIKYLPEKYASPLAVNVYGDKVAILFWSKEHPFAVVIKNKGISEGYKNYFALLWKIAKPL